MKKLITALFLLTLSSVVSAGIEAINMVGYTQVYRGSNYTAYTTDGSTYIIGTFSQTVTKSIPVFCRPITITGLRGTTTYVGPPTTKFTFDLVAYPVSAGGGNFYSTLYGQNGFSRALHDTIPQDFNWTNVVQYGDHAYTPANNTSQFVVALWGASPTQLTRFQYFFGCLDANGNYTRTTFYIYD